MGELGCNGLSKTAAPTPRLARLLPGLNTLLHTLSLRADPGVCGVLGVAGLAGIDMDLWYVLPSASISYTYVIKKKKLIKEIDR